MKRLGNKASGGFAVPLAAGVSMVVALLIAGALEFMRVQLHDMGLLRVQAIAQPFLQSTLSMTGLMLRASLKDAVGLTPDAVVGRRLLGIRDERIFFDGTPFDVVVLERRLRLSIQDEAGLAPLNSLTLEEMTRLLVNQGVPRDIAQRFAAEAEDFRDFDDTRQQGGAERDDYLRDGLRAPKNRAFNHLGELGLLRSAPLFSNVLKAPQLRRFGVDRSGQINLNAASQPLLVEAFEFTDASARRFVEQRRQSQIGTDQLRSFAHRMDSFLDRRMSGGPSNRFRIEVTDVESGAMLRSTLLIEPVASNSNFDQRTAGPTGIRPNPAPPASPIDREVIDFN